MRLCFAPMEGVTGRTFRELHAACFPGIDRYCLPFLSPTQDHLLTPRQRRELDPGELGCDRLLPQILTKDAEDFLWAASAMAELGYREVNLNLGCPSGTVVSKGKGAGMLRDLSALARFLDRVFSESPIAVSVKTRIGLENPGEWGSILELFSRYPIAELTVHPRTRREMYTGDVHFDALRRAAEAASFSLCCNGNLFTPSDVKAAERAVPGLSGLMFARGLLADPALATRLRGGARRREDLIAFHNGLCRAYLATMHPDGAVLPKLKELWMYLCLLFPDEGQWKRLRKTKKWADFYPLTQSILRQDELLEEADFSRLGQRGLAEILRNHGPVPGQIP